MNALGEIYVWGYFDIPPNGSQLIQDQPPLQPDPDPKRPQNKKQPPPKAKSKIFSRAPEPVPEPVARPPPKEEFARAPQRLRFLFDKSLKMKIKNYVIDAE